VSRPFVRTRRRWTVIAALACALLSGAAIGLVACSDGPAQRLPGQLGGPLPSGGGGTPSRPNIVFVLTDDLSWNLVRYMPHVLGLEQAGMTFTNYTVTDSLCCPSRASIFTGDFPHDTHVITNSAPSGGATKFRAEGDDRSTFATDIQAAGYRTGFIGKYLNQYNPNTPIGTTPARLHDAYVPPGWTSWNAVGDHGYGEYDYTMTDGHRTNSYRHAPDDYLTYIAQQRGEQFITSAAAQRQPFMLEIATFSPHTPYTPAPQDVGTFNGVTVPRTPAFDHLPRNPPAWLASHPPLTRFDIALLNQRFQLRVEAVQSVDRMVGQLESLLARINQLQDTVFVFSSDNGYHMGEYGLHAGKQTAFDTDVLVPLIAAGPGIPAGSTNSNVTENIDLRPTFDELAGATTPSDVDGHSLVPLLHGEQLPWRTVAGIEHHRPPQTPLDPDRQNAAQGTPPSYDAIRTASFTYVRYVDGEREYYDRRTDPYELDNIAGSLSRARLAALDRIVDRLSSCHGTAACWSAALPQRIVRAPGAP
jgi:N-acetylglucosamine-6-sulfatase